MSLPDDPRDLTMTHPFNTTLVREGRGATTEAELRLFVQEVERRPIRQLLEDLPGLARLSRTKFDLVLGSIRQRISDQPLAMRERMAALVRIWADGAENGEIATRLRELADRSNGENEIPG